MPLALCPTRAREAPCLQVCSQRCGLPGRLLGPLPAGSRARHPQALGPCALRRHAALGPPPSAPGPGAPKKQKRALAAVKRSGNTSINTLGYAAGLHPRPRGVVRYHLWPLCFLGLPLADWAWLPSGNSLALWSGDIASATRCRAAGWTRLRPLRRTWGAGRALGFDLTPLPVARAAAGGGRVGL